MVFAELHPLQTRRAYPARPGQWVHTGQQQPDIAQGSLSRSAALRCTKLSLVLQGDKLVVSGKHRARKRAVRYYIDRIMVPLTDLTKKACSIATTLCVRCTARSTIQKHSNRRWYGSWLRMR
jgi:hypothetical protein